MGESFHCPHLGPWLRRFPLSAHLDFCEIICELGLSFLESFFNGGCRQHFEIPGSGVELIHPMGFDCVSGELMEIRKHCDDLAEVKKGA